MICVSKIRDDQTRADGKDRLLSVSKKNFRHAANERPETVLSFDASIS